MNESQIKTALFSISIFGLGAVALILYQHSQHTGQILGAMNAGSSPAPATVPNSSPVATSLASLAGQPTPGQSNLVPQPAAVSPLTVGSYHSISGGLLN